MAKLTVNISDKIEETLQSLVQTAFGIGGSFVTRGGVVHKEDTFMAKNIRDNEKVICIGAGKPSRVEPLKWRRSKNVQNESYTSANATNSDALKFKSKVAVKVYGFMWNKDYNDKEFTLKFQFRVDNDEPSEWFETTRLPE